MINPNGSLHFIFTPLHVSLPDFHFVAYQKDSIKLTRFLKTFVHVGLESDFWLKLIPFLLPQGLSIPLDFWWQTWQQKWYGRSKNHLQWFSCWNYNVRNPQPVSFWPCHRRSTHTWCSSLVSIGRHHYTSRLPMIQPRWCNWPAS